MLGLPRRRCVPRRIRPNVERGPFRCGMLSYLHLIVASLVLALLFLAMMELVLRESAEEHRAAQRVRARVTAQVLAENAAELAAEDMVDLPGRSIEKENDDGTMKGRYRRTGNHFEIEAKGVSKGTVRTESTLRLEGRIQGTSIRIESAQYR